MTVGPWAPAGFFTGWAIKGSEGRKSHRGPGAEPQWGSAPEAKDI